MGRGFNSEGRLRGRSRKRQNPQTAAKRPVKVCRLRRRACVPPKKRRPAGRLEVGTGPGRAVRPAAAQKPKFVTTAVVAEMVTATPGLLTPPELATRLYLPAAELSGLKASAVAVAL